MGEVQQETVEKAHEVDYFYRDKVPQLMLLTLMMVFFVFALGGVIVLFRSIALPPPLYFAANPSGALIVEEPLVNPGIQENVLLTWVVEGVMASHTFNFMNYSTVMSAANDYFTQEGYESYKTALTDAKMIDRVIAQKLVLRAVPLDAPQILLGKPFEGRYTWKIKLPIQFKYQSSTTNFSETMNATLVVMRVPTSISSMGIAIVKFDLEKIKG